MAVGAGCGRTSRTAWGDTTGSESRDPHVSTFLCPAPTHTRSPDKLSEPLARPLLDTDDSNLSGVGAGPDGEPGGGAVTQEIVVGIDRKYEDAEEVETEHEVTTQCRIHTI